MFNHYEVRLSFIYLFIVTYKAATQKAEHLI